MLDFEKIKDRLLETTKENADIAGIYDRVLEDIKNDYETRENEYKTKNDELIKKTERIDELEEKVRELQDTNMRLFTKISNTDVDEKEENEDELDIDELSKLFY